MAIDQALLEISTIPVLRVYDWDQPTTSLGYSQAFKSEEHSTPVVRRWTGGGTVLHGDDSTYAIIVPATHSWAQTRPLDSYQLLHSALAEALNEFCCGPCTLATKDDSKPGERCFEAPVEFDVLRSGQKISGAGQRRGQLGLLHQGSVSIRLTPDFWQGLAAAIADHWSSSNTHDPEVMKRAESLIQTRYGSESWLHSKRDAD